MAVLVKLEYILGKKIIMAIINAINKVTDIQVFSTTGYTTWTKPTGAKFVYVVCVGGGAGGGSGSVAGNANIHVGGGGGGCGTNAGRGGNGGNGGRGEVRVYSW